MAYAEKRGNGPAPWRVKYKLPDGSETSESGFETKESALNYGREQEADIRRGRWVDRSRGEITLAEWDALWWPAQDLAIKSRTNYRGSIDNHILPKFGQRTLNSLDSRIEIDGWERKVSKRHGPAAAKAARQRLTTMLGDAVDEGRMQMNPALRQKKRGRRVKQTEEKEIVWIDTPLRALLFAERCGLLTGRAADFVEAILVPYTGMRYGETIGLEPVYVQPGRIRVEWQLVEDAGRFYKTPPKVGSRRTLDVPPFIDELVGLVIGDQVCQHAAWGPREDIEDGEEPCQGGVKYVFLGERGGHLRNSNYNRRVFDPAAEGWFPKDAKRRGPRKPVLVDMAAGWPGRPIPSAWPAADPGRPFEPPTGFRQGRKRVDLEVVSPASWLPLVPGLTPHGWRHTHEVWMDEDHIPDVLQRERLGHEKERSDRGRSKTTRRYQHVSDGMRAELRQALQMRWEMGLMQRAELAPRSPLGVLDKLLEPYRRGRQAASGSAVGRGSGSGSPRYLPTTTKAASE